MHRYIMHRRVDVYGLRAIYERHTRQHHQYFTDLEPTIDTTREFRIVFFPWRVLATLEIGRHTSELQSLMRNSYAVFFLKTTNNTYYHIQHNAHKPSTHTDIRTKPHILHVRKTTT